MLLGRRGIINTRTRMELEIHLFIKIRDKQKLPKIVSIIILGTFIQFLIKTEL